MKCQITTNSQNFLIYISRYIYLNILINNLKDVDNITMKGKLKINPSGISESKRNIKDGYVMFGRYDPTRKNKI